MRFVMLNDEEHTLRRFVRSMALNHRLKHRFRRSPFHDLTSRWNAIHGVHHFEIFLCRATDNELSCEYSRSQTPYRFVGKQNVHA